MRASHRPRAAARAVSRAATKPRGLLRDYPDARIRSGPLEEQLAGGVPGAIVHRDDFEVRVGLRAERRDALGQVVGPVPGRKQDGDRGCPHPSGRDTSSRVSGCAAGTSLSSTCGASTLAHTV